MAESQNLFVNVNVIVIVAAKSVANIRVSSSVNKLTYIIVHPMGSGGGSVLVHGDG